MHMEGNMNFVLTILVVAALAAGLDAALLRRPQARLELRAATSCPEDAARLCIPHKGGSSEENVVASRLFACLVKKRRQMPGSCQGFVDMIAACADDVERFCSGKTMIPAVECIAQHQQHISSKCRHSPWLQEHHEAFDAAAADDELRAAVDDDDDDDILAMARHSRTLRQHADCHGRACEEDPDDYGAGDL